MEQRIKRIMRNAIKRMLGKPDSNGLYHSRRKLRKTYHKIMNLSRKEQANYSDDICRRNTETDNVDAALNSSFFAEWNTTSIGNIAHISLYHKNINIRVHACEIIELFTNWYNEKYLSNRQKTFRILRMFYGNIPSLSKRKISKNRKLKYAIKFAVYVFCKLKVYDSVYISTINSLLKKNKP